MLKSRVVASLTSLVFLLTVSCSSSHKKETQLETSSVAQSAAHHSHHKAGEVPADKALGWLVNGNIRYRNGKVRHDGAQNSDRERLVNGQFPHSIILSCSDSRTPPEVIFDQKLGEMFVVRSAGESLDSAVIASIEYAIEHLGANLIVVMGHESCGAVKAAYDTAEDQDAGSPSLNALVHDLRPHMSTSADRKPSSHYIDESWANVHGVAKDLLQKSQIIRDAVLSGEVKIKPALYYLKSGEVQWSKEKL